MNGDVSYFDVNEEAFCPFILEIATAGVKTVTVRIFSIQVNCSPLLEKLVAIKEICNLTILCSLAVDH